MANVEANWPDVVTKSRHDWVNQTLGYAFKSTDLLDQALTHKSAGNPHAARLEFLGDSVLGLAITHHLYVTYPTADQGLMSRHRANLVSKTSLADLASKIDLEEVITLGQAFKHKQAITPAMLADTLESLFGAMACDSDFSAAASVIIRLFHQKSELFEQTVTKDDKTNLQEYCQQHQYPLPVYQGCIRQPNGHPEHYHGWVKGYSEVFEKSGPSKRVVEQALAKVILAYLRQANKDKRR